MACLHLSLCVLQASFANDTFLSKALRFGFGSLKSWNPCLANPCLSRLIPFQELCSPRCGSCHKACALLATQAFVTLAPIIISLGCTVEREQKCNDGYPVCQCSHQTAGPRFCEVVNWFCYLLISLVHSCSQLRPQGQWLFLCATTRSLMTWMIDCRRSAKLKSLSSRCWTIRICGLAFACLR